jgi:uncharacterized OB-fold protein
MPARGKAHESFVAGLEAGMVLLPKCSDCQRTFFYPRLHCPHCFGRAIELERFGDELRVRSFAWVWRPQSPAPIESLPVLMVVVGSDDFSLFAEGRGWSEDAPPIVGEVVELAVDRRSSNEAIAVAARRAS